MYNQISWKLGYGVARGVDYVDKNIIDGTVNGLSNAVVGSGEVLSKIQTGNVRNYAAVVLTGVALLFIVALALFYFMGGL
jgi:NADH:ubiquinone oxidoreductase subunit 5 (subunit L)/multisubunit Na+/H+ antiporter MnhA subunit